MTTARFSALTGPTTRAIAAVRSQHCQPPTYRPTVHAEARDAAVVARAISILKKRGYTGTAPHDWTGEPEAKAAYDEHMTTADALERQHAELATLRQGYDAARLEIESLRAAHFGIQWQCGQQANGFTAPQPPVDVVRVCPECDIAGCRHMRTAPAVAQEPVA